MYEVQIFVEDTGSDTIGRFILEAKKLIKKHEDEVNKTLS